jgi:hypothetical protein
MEAMGMIQTATALFAAAAAGGAVMAAIRMAGKRNPPHWLAMAHGFLAGAGLTLLLYAACTVGLPGRAMTATVLLVLAAVGGVVLNLAYQMKGRPLPVGFMLGHAALAVVAFALLLSVVFA